MVEARIKKIKGEKLTAVFFIVNPLTAILSRLIIEKFNLNKRNVFIVSFRNSSLDLLDFESIFIEPRRIDAYRQKILFDSPGARKVLKHLNNSFVLFTPWAFREANWLIKSKKCKGHFYIEEGQGSYMDYQTFNYDKIPLITFIKNNFKNRVNNGDGNGYFFRDDSSGFIGLHPKCFPKIKSEEKYFLNNTNKIMQFYKPKTNGIKEIALSCAERRLIDNNWEAMIFKLIEYLPKGGLIKLHPSFYMSQDKINKIKNYLLIRTNNQVKLCGKEVILEIEMLYENKNLYGPQTTLSFYALFFGSNFKTIKLP